MNKNHEKFGFSQFVFMAFCYKYLKMNEVCVCHLSLAENKSKY